MDNNFPKLQLENFTRGFNDFYNEVCLILKDADENSSLVFLIPDEVDAQYRYSDYKRNYQTRYDYIHNHFLDSENTDLFLSFFNEVVTCQFNSFGLSSDTWKNSPCLRTSVLRLSDLIGNINNPAVFKLDFHYDNESKQIKRKLDAVTTEIINNNANEIDAGNNARYQDCVDEFLQFKRSLIKDPMFFYNQSLDRLKRVVENTLKNKYSRSDGTFPKLSDRKQISNILFGNQHAEFENRIGYIIENIHHEKEGQPKKFTEKEYVYLWLELNQILYLLNRYSVSREGSA